MYNPEAPSITNSSRPMYQRHRPIAQRSNLIGLTMGEVDLPPRGETPPKPPPLHPAGVEALMTRLF